MSKFSDHSDSNHVDLVSKAKAGDEIALAELFDRFKARLRRVVEVRMDHRLKGKVDPSDVLQEAFLDLANKLPAYTQRDVGMSMFVWMRLVASEKLIQIHRKHFDVQKRNAGREVSIDAAIPDHSSICLAGHLLGRFSSAGNKLIRQEMKQVLMATLDAMDDIDREIILMRGFEELSNVEAAESLGLSQNGASNRYVRAMTRLKKELELIPGFSI